VEKLIISACLTGENCKYSGGSNKLDDEVLERLARRYVLIPVCPERDGGLSVPRAPAEIVGSKVITVTGTDVTKEYRSGAETALNAALDNGCGKALLKARSPSCGKDHVYDGTFSHTLIKGDGIAAALLKDNGIIIFDETETGALI